jgi:aminopeptidase N
MQTDNGSSNKVFAFPGSIAQYLPLLSFTIDYMVLKIKPDFESNTLPDCEETLQITARRQINEIEFDIAEMKIEKVVSFNTSINNYNDNKDGNTKELHFDTKDDKLIIKLAKELSNDDSISLTIKYSAGYQYVKDRLVIAKPRSGFHFIEYDEFHRKMNHLQSWTQGESVESKYWFPCIDQPQVKYPRKLEVTVPENYVVISNGKEKSKNIVEKAEEEKPISDSNKLVRHIWEEPIPNSTYLTSIVIGIFGQEKKEYSSGDKKIQLLYYWPADFNKEDAILNFQNTPKMIKSFEEYIKTEYPYNKYAQVAVEDFEFGGMENTSCTTLTRDILFDKRGSLDYTSEDVISHELAHQWFGDLVTCKDWPHIWLNEGFATYFEALYWEASRGKDEFQYYMVQMADAYLNEASTLYKRPIVTKVYKHPDELFDAHSYKKGGCVLHMLRNYVGNDLFRESLCKYLETYKTKTAETNDLQTVLEDVSGRSLGQFFDQWIYAAGHPELNIEFSKERNNRDVKLKVTQTHEGMIFEFDLDIILVYYSTANDDNGSIKEKRLHESLKISAKETEKSFKIPVDDKGQIAKIKRFSIDPQFKVLKEIKSIKAPEEVLINELKDGETIFSKVQAARALGDKFSDTIIESLKNIILNENTFWGVATEAANTLGSYNDVDDYVKTDKAYRTLVECFSSGIKNPKSRRVVVRNIGVFENGDSIKLFEQLIQYHKDPSYFVEAEAATAIGKSSKHILDKRKKEEMISILKNVAETIDTFRNVPARWAINGLKEFFKDDDKHIVSEVASFLINKSKYGNHDLVRWTATPALGKFLLDKDKKVNSHVFERLKELLRDERSLIRSSACTAFADPDAKPSKPGATVLEIIDELTMIAEHDIDGFTRRAAEASINIIKGWVKEWSETPSPIDVRLREKELTSREEKIRKHHERTLESIRRRLLVTE